MTEHTHDLTITVTDEDGSVLLDQIISVECDTVEPTETGYGNGGYGELAYGA